MVPPAPIELSSIGMADSLILMILALVVFGPRRLPQIGRQIGKLMYEFRKASNDFKFQMEEELRLAEETDRRTKEEAARQQAALAAPATGVETPTTLPALEPTAASPYPGEGNYPPQYPAENEPAEPEELVHLPRVAAPIIQPPSTGAPVAASRPNSVIPAELELQTDIALKANADAEPVATPAVTPSESQQTEPTTQHG